MVKLPKTLEWKENALFLLDQTRLPLESVEFRCDTVEAVSDAIRRLVVRGAPAIGVAAAYGVALAARSGRDAIPPALTLLAESRPTAVNLFWALARMRGAYEAGASADDLLAEAREIERDDRERCERIGAAGAELLPARANIITHCHAGALATAGIGTALGVIYKAVEAGKDIRVFADETRPLLQGARITAWELMEAGVDVTLITDSMAAFAMARKSFDAVIVGADRIAANGDVANKIGTYGLAVNARRHNIPFYVAAPLSTIDLEIPDGNSIPIEERGDEEITEKFGVRTAPHGVKTWSPAFDVTPAELVTRIITDQGVVVPGKEAIAELFQEKREKASAAS